MNPAPITDAMAKVKAAVRLALAPLAGTYNNLPRVYWMEASQGAPLPLFIQQSQDDGGMADPTLGNGGWRGLWTVKALAASDAAADAFLAGVPAVMNSLTVAGYTTTVTFQKNMTLPPVDGAWTAGLIYEIALAR